jgi:hypothetical protein
MDDQRTTIERQDPARTSPRTGGGAGAPTRLGQGGTGGNPAGPRDANDPGATRYGKGRGSGSNEPPHRERKEEAGWTSRQGGDQSAGPGTEPRHEAKEVKR